MRAWMWVLAWGLAACGGGSDAELETGAAASTAALTEAAGRCDYVNPFSAAPECKEYLGASWTAADAEDDCQAPVLGGDAGVFVGGETCVRDTFIGECVVDGDSDTEVVIVFPGSDPESCSGAELGCTFAGGSFVPSEVCTADTTGIPPEDAFVQFQQVCVEPIDGEPAGAGPDGLVCTWEAISASTEEGRRFVDYASCEPVLTQRPYYPYTVSAGTSPDDARLGDAEWVEEFEWVTGQVESSACTCCHSSSYAPDGPSGWYVEDGPIWLDGVGDAGLAMLAGWVDSTVFGAFPAEENNGFDRETTGLPTTDVSRMAAFLEGELARRGLTRDDFADTAPFGGPLYDQLIYEPGACEEGQGMESDGTLVWTGGAARYLYVLGADSMSPGVPPNLDTPDGTLWRVDVPHTAQPIPSGVAYGSAPTGSAQAYPVDGAAPALESGQTYYLVALLDVYQPATRCLFTAP